ncbi:LytR C-terminal domain-containing protein [Streptomyces sp. XM4193]|uniref:LytR C-terminal domain-containing protein n=1 Tax=Streptomyces sp. XM4193 TaxID=2929782 RepID=UPI001FFAB64D|nr:LytR C-terminal domain-containing protein [Streptomyces sp. XM4193]MCK1794779.1 LytR C-terminal domain-containing protein [Streptomyces sp. XM4193]
MSMLTPPGMGGKYRITGNRYPKMHRPKRRFRLVFRIVASTAALGLVAWGSVQLIDVFTTDSGGDTVKASSASGPASGDCKPGATGADTAPVKAPKPSAITVNVYNATDRTGLAKDTADELKKRGFKIGEVDNAPEDLDKKVKEPGLLLGAPAAKKDGSLAVLGTQLAKADTRTDDARKGKAAKSVDLVIGDGYKKLVKAAAADRAVTELTKPRPTPSPSDC